MLSMPLPSRNELCEFALKPVSHTVKDVIQFIKDEDGGVERAAIYSTDGNRISQSTPVEILMQSDFKIVINEREFEVIPPKEGKPLREVTQCCRESFRSPCGRRISLFDLGYVYLALKQIFCQFNQCPMISVIRNIPFFLQ